MDRKITVRLPESMVERIESLEKVPIEEFIDHMVRDYFEDQRRRSIPLKDFAISWHVEVYDAMIDHVGTGGVGGFIRDTVYRALSKKHRDLIPPPEWAHKGGMHRPAGKKRRTKAPRAKQHSDRTSAIRSIIIPEQWYERIKEDHKYPGRWVKAVVQRRLEQETGKPLPVQRGMKDYLRDE